MSTDLKHIAVCICTFKRPQLLKRLLEALALQDTVGQFSYSITIVDNDEHKSAEAVVREYSMSVPVNYFVEERQNIAMARNKAVEQARGDYIAFIDDDEFPGPQWLLNLLKTLENQHADGVLGPVKPHYDAPPPKWLLKGRFHERPTYPTGHVLEWSLCRSGNVLLKSALFPTGRQAFRPECLTGEDQDFFRRMIAEGHRFVWCSEAPVFEVVPPARWRRSYLIRRSLFQGVFSFRNYGFQPRRVVTSIVATPVYIVALPFAALFGPATFMNCASKLSYHLGRLLAVLGINPFPDTYVTQ